VEVEWNWQALYVAQSPLVLAAYNNSGLNKSILNHEENSGSNSSAVKMRNREILLQSYVYPFIYFDQPSEKHWKPKLEIDAVHNQLVISGNLGSLQFFDINTAVVTEKLNVSERKTKFLFEFS
jgi:hypothetical protein